MIEALARAVVLLVGLYLVGLAVVALMAPATASRFLLGHAGSPAAHYLEVSLRLIAGGALIVNSSRMLFPAVFRGLGWVLVLTTAVLLLAPWRWHRHFTQLAVPRALRFLPVLAAASFLLGAFVLLAALRP